ncbi:hypothetical protein FB567DRAFT_128381 [Paraphoma chrysanthemicola]|uniref:Heterokaryon incompatibility domain-containing protein n=1 Tax=Paraphoma chrysanthemicola TaxID=798071 RepID=A0A8K0VW48_9PLEO|nr:hypothetical protein FB567DRAFT_128381 [Paraphoma chrysanthemicola]
MAHAPVEKTPRHLRSYVLDLAKHPYWRRAWVRQEMILAKTRKIACGSVTIHVDALFRCISSYILSSTVFERDEWMVHMDLEMRLRRLCRPRVQHQHFWDVFGLSGEIPNCSDPRDRIYSILAVTGQDQTFRIDYSEDIVSFFWRALHYFSPETDPGKVQRLWNSLELTPSAMGQAVEANGAPLQAFIPMRRNKIKPNLRRQLPGLFRLRRAGLCAHDPFNFARAQVQGYTRHDILLCPGTSNDLNEDGFYRNTIDLEGMHVLVHPLGPPEAGFTLTLLSTTYRRLPQPAGTELWSSIDGAETRIQKWSEVERVAGLSGFSNIYDDNWKSRPHFMLKLSHQYVIECVKAVQDYWDEKYRRSWTETPKADKFQNDVLMAIGLKKRKHKSNS